MRITVLSGGVGGANFLKGLLDVVGPEDEVTVIGNTADDIWLFGLRVCPDLDTVMYTLGGGIDVERKWGRTDETWNAKEELTAYGVDNTWFGLGDRDLATHIIRTQLLHEGVALAAITERLCERWKPGVRLLPMTEDEVETHIGIDGEDGLEVIHFQEYWIRLGAKVPVRAGRVPRRGGGHGRSRRRRGDPGRRPGHPAAVEPHRVDRRDPVGPADRDAPYARRTRPSSVSRPSSAGRRCGGWPISC